MRRSFISRFRRRAITGGIVGLILASGILVDRFLAWGVAYGGVPLNLAYPHPITVLENEGYVVGYDEDRRNPAWAAYHVGADYRFDPVDRPANFATDVRTESQVSHDDYTGSGHDRGHLAPNWAIATRYGAAAQQETFLMTNIVPQRPALNRGPWKELELAIASRGARRHDGLWVVCGPLYDEDDERLPSGVAIPDAFFMIVIDTRFLVPRALGFILPQDVPDEAEPRDCIRTVDDIEHRSGLDFFANVPDFIEEPMEARLPPYWLE